MDRKAHYLRANTHCETPSQAIWFDTETEPVPMGAGKFGHRLTFGWAVYRRQRDKSHWCAPEWLRFTSKSDFWRWVTDHCRNGARTYLFCHNTNFDLPVLDVFHEMPKLGWQMTTACIDAPPTIITFRRERQSIVILDTLNFWRLPLKSVSEMVGLPKLRMPKETASKEAWDRYGKRDTEILMRACISWWDMLVRLDMGGFAHTLAGQAFRTFRHKYLTAKLLVHDHTDVLELERRAYKGGRTEAFRIGNVKGRIHCYDVNSLYPSVMSDGIYPAKLLFRLYGPRGREYVMTHPTDTMIADVLLETDVPRYPVVRDGRLVFPVGRFRTTLCGPELLAAIENDHIRDITLMSQYELVPMFADFVRDIYALRLAAKKRGDSPSTYYLKILMNSLYGKFGQRGQIWSELKQTDDLSARVWKEHDFDTGETRKCRQLGGLQQTLLEQPEGLESIPSIAAFVTARARTRLWELLQLAGMENVVYCDTDSLYVNDAGARRLTPEIDPDRLGKLKLEGTSRGMTIYGPKDYKFGGHWKIKGIRSKAEWVGESGAWQEKWSGLRGLLSGGNLAMPTTEPVFKHLTRNYAKGVVGSDGRVSPLELSEEASD